MWTLREIRARYKQSLFGFAWAVFQPLALTITFVVVFSFIIRFPTDGIPYPIFVYSAMLPWTFFTRGVGGSVGSIVGNMSLITKVRLPRTLFPIATILTYFVDFLVGATIFVGLMIYYRVSISPAMALLPALLATQILFMIGVALSGAALNVLFRDVAQMTPLLLQIWMYATPIIYPLSLVPDWLRPWYLLVNPMAGLIHSYRTILLLGEVPSGLIIGVSVLMSLLVFFAGLALFNKLERGFADII